MGPYLSVTVGGTRASRAGSRRGARTVHRPGATGGARAQTPDPSRELKLFESTERDEDPLSIDDATGSDLERAAANLPKPAPPPPPSPRTGEALSAIDGVQEEAHRVAVTLGEGLARVETRLTFGSRATHAAEVAYRRRSRWRGPDARRTLRGRARATRELRAKGGSSAARPARTRSREVIADARGPAVALRTSPITKGRAWRLRVHYVAPHRCWRSRALRASARGYDPRIARRRCASTRRRSRRSRRHRAGASIPRAPSCSPGACAPGGRDAAARVAAARHAARRSYRAGTRDPCRSRLAVDRRVPSMEGPARGRAAAVVSALLALLRSARPCAHTLRRARRGTGRFDVDGAGRRARRRDAAKPRRATAVVGGRAERPRAAP